MIPRGRIGQNREGEGRGRIRTQECIERSSFSSSVDSNLYQLWSLGVERGHKGDECFTYEFIYKIIKKYSQILARKTVTSLEASVGS